MTYAESLKRLSPRVTVRVPGSPDRQGVRHGEFKNWISVKLDGRHTINWFWHEYVTVN